MRMEGISTAPLGALGPMSQQRWSRIVPVVFIMYTVAFVDRTNVSLALPLMSRDLHMDATQAGAASGIFFLGYILLQAPFGYLASRWSPKMLVAILLIIWGACSAATGLVHTWLQFMIMRFLLGLAESGVWPATLVLISRWFPQTERARANAYWMLCLPTAVVLSSPLSGWILGRWDWRVLLIGEGMLPIVWLIIWIAYIDDSPSQSSRLSSEEREYLESALHLKSNATSPAKKQPFLASLFSRQVFLLMAISFLVSAGNYGYLFWLPSVIESSSLLSGNARSHFAVGVLNAIPYVFAAIGMILISKHSDRHSERSKHIAVALACAGACLIASALAVGQWPTLAFALLCLVGGGSYGMLGPFWAIPTETLPPAVAGSAIGLIQFSNLGGALGPTLIGYLEKQTGTFTRAFVLLGGGWLIAALLCLLLKPARCPDRVILVR
jgi:MFS family permease